ncbi:DUF4921 family protein [Propionibacteriaceae bacterium Y1923]|uniref:DUF4921 family protein n=1 Tax=Aestuariimicrobium sp. Y1814 TaxID=3418742 RepID=UPI003C1E84A9
MAFHSQDHDNYISVMADGTVKQRNPFSGTNVWTVPGRGHRPLTSNHEQPLPLDPADHGRYCAFCEKRYLETPPEKYRVIHHDGHWQTLRHVPAEELFDTVAEFRRIPNLFEILSFDYWNLNYGYQIPHHVALRRAAYLATPAGREHVLAIATTKLRAAGRQDDLARMSPDEVIESGDGLFGGCHDVIVGRRHFVDGASDTSQLASSGTLTPEEHYQYIKFTVETLARLYATNRYARYVAVFQNWLKPAGASFDHLHKQVVAIDERGGNNESAIAKLRVNPNLYNEAAVNYASYHNLLLAENAHAVAFAGFGHRYPSIDIYSKSPTSNPFEQTADEVRGMSDVLHAIHAATGSDIACNEEWHHRPADVDVAMPWHITVKWRLSTVAGFEGGTKLYLNTLDPYALRDRLLPVLGQLREADLIAPLMIGDECPGTPNRLHYNRGR